MGSSAKVNLVNLLDRSGFDLHKLMDAVGYPKVMAMNVEFYDAADFGGGNRPDDDFRITVDDTVLTDQRRRLQGYEYASFGMLEDESKPRKDRTLKIGAMVKIDTVDVLGGFHTTKTWRIDFAYSDGSTRSVFGGIESRARSPEPANPTPPLIGVLYDNGGCYIPNPDTWPIPKSLTPESGNLIIPANGQPLHD